MFIQKHLIRFFAFFEVLEFLVLSFLFPTMEQVGSLNIQHSMLQFFFNSLNVTLEQ
jgi:hypothetical protein